MRRVPFLAYLLSLSVFVVSGTSCKQSTDPEDPNPPASTDCAGIAGAWRSHLIATGGPGAPWWEVSVSTLSGNCSFTGTVTGMDGHEQAGSGSIALSSGGIVTRPGEDDARGAVDMHRDVMVITNTWTGTDAGTVDLMVAVNCDATYSLADVEGHWESFHLASEPGAPWWMRGTFDITSGGSFHASMIDDEGDTEEVDGAFEMDGDGVLTAPGIGEPGERTELDAGKTVMVGSATWDSGSPGTAEFWVMVKMAESYSTSDLAGTWEMHSISSGSGPWWQRSTMVIGSDGSFTATATENDGDVDTITGTFPLSAGGIIESPDDPTFRAALDAGKTVLVGTSTHDNGATAMWVGVKIAP